MVQYENVLDEEKCIFCLNCVVVCPFEVIGANWETKKVFIENPVACMACINCEESCPTGAIKIVGDKRIDWKIPPERWPKLYNKILQTT